MADLDELESFCDELEDSEADRVVVRWIDEQRPVQEEGGVTIRSVTEVTIKGAVDGEVVSKTYEEVPYAEIKALLAPYDFEVLYRSDNLTR